MNPNIARKQHAKSAQLRNEQSRSNDPSEHRQLNVGDFERQVSMWGGIVLAVYGLLRGSMSGLALAAIGGALIWRGHTGHCEMYHMLGHSSADQVSQGRRGSGATKSQPKPAEAQYVESHSAD